MLRLGLLDAIHDSQRCPRGQDVVSSCRRVTCAKASAGKRDGPAGTKSGPAALTWAFAEAAVLLLRHHVPGQQSLARWEQKHGQGPALPILAHTVARAGYSLFLRETVCEMDTCLNGSGSSAGEPAAALDPYGLSLH